MTGFVLWAGGSVERLAALLNASNWLLNVLLEPPRASAAYVFSWPDFVVDLAFALLFVGLTLRVRRSWMALLSAFLILGVANHISFLTDHTLFQRAFMTAAYVWAYGVLGCLAYAGWSAYRARRRICDLAGMKRDA